MQLSSLDFRAQILILKFVTQNIVHNNSQTRGQAWILRISKLK